MLTVGSLFSGIGGIELGLERTGGFKVIWNCEIDAYASAVLKKHWPEVPNLGDITKVDWNGIEKPDMLCGGFPCQDISIAGKKKGIQENTRSGLWWEYARAIRSLRPTFALIENVPELANAGLDVVLSDLASLGYDAEWINLSASDVGAWHKRERIFIIAYSQLKRCDNRGNNEREHEDNSERKQVEGSSRFRGLRSIACEMGVVPNSLCFGLEGVGFKKCIRSERLAESYKQNRQNTWAVEPDVGRVANGISSRVDRIKCLGNAVVPQVAEVIGEMILNDNAGGGAKLPRSWSPCRE